MFFVSRLINSCHLLSIKSKFNNISISYKTNNSSTAWLYDCPHHLSPSYIAEQCYDETPIVSLDTVMYVDFSTRQNFEFANQILCENNRQNVIALDAASRCRYLFPKGTQTILELCSLHKTNLLIIPYYSLVKPLAMNS